MGMDGCQGQLEGFPAPLRRFGVIFRGFRGVFVLSCIPIFSFVLWASGGGGGGCGSCWAASKPPGAPTQGQKVSRDGTLLLKHAMPGPIHKMLDEGPCPMGAERSKQQ